MSKARAREHLATLIKLGVPEGPFWIELFNFLQELAAPDEGEIGHHAINALQEAETQLQEALRHLRAVCGSERGSVWASDLLNARAFLKSKETP